MTFKNGDSLYCLCKIRTSEFNKFQKWRPIYHSNLLGKVPSDVKLSNIELIFHKFACFKYTFCHAKLFYENNQEKEQSYAKSLNLWLCQVQASAADICFKMQKLQQKSWWFTVVWCRQAIERKQVSHFAMHLGRLDNKIYLLDSFIDEKKI